MGALGSAISRALLFGLLLFAYVVLLKKLISWSVSIDHKLSLEHEVYRKAATSAGVNPSHITSVRRKYARNRVAMRFGAVGPFTLVGMVLLSFGIEDPSPVVAIWGAYLLWLVWFCARRPANHVSG